MHTRAHTRTCTLVPNVALRNAITEWRAVQAEFAAYTQAAEAALEATSSLAESESLVFELTGRISAGPGFEWNVQNFSRLQKRMYSEPFEAGGVKWRILLFPRGNGKSAEQASLSMYLDVHNAKSLPVFNDTRSTVRRRWSERACVGCAGGMAILRNVRPCDLEPQDKHSVEEDCVAHVLCGSVRHPPLPHTRWAWACWHARVWAIAPRPPWE
jgi:hypothetical protein